MQAVVTARKVKKNLNGFTIVELLIVIVVIAILAAITLVTFGNVQSRARDNIRYADAKAIMKALELYKADNGRYPDTGPNGTAICGTHNNGYSYSDATDGNWMKPLVDNKYLNKVPTPPNNGCSSFYRYLWPGATTYNCPSRTTNYYIIEVRGVEGMSAPADAADPSDGSDWKPCPAATAGWGGGSTNWVFAKDDI